MYVQEKFTLPSEVSLDQVRDALTKFQNAKVESHTADSLTVTLGKRIFFWIAGIYLTSNYDAPMKVTVTRGAETTVVVERNVLQVLDTKKSVAFFNDTAERIKQSLTRLA